MSNGGGEAGWRISYLAKIISVMANGGPVAESGVMSAEES
jgi:hypothetical protein